MLPDLLHRARRRVIAQLVLDKGALALVIGMGGAILLLLAGTQILDWWWPILLAAVSLGVGIYQLRQHVPSIYTLAQRIDERLHLADTLSTAVYFTDHPKPGAEAVCEVQRRSAEDTARSVDLEQALPYTRSRWLFPAAGLLLVAAGLFAVRYAVVGSMDLSPSLVGMALDTFFQSPAEEEAKLNARADLRPNPFDPSQQASATEELSELSPEEAAELMEAEGKQEEGNASGDEGKQEDPTAEAQDENEGSAQEKDKQGDKSGDKDGKESEQQEGNNDDRSMMDKLRDAVSNLLNQMKSDQNKQQAQQKGDQKGKSGEKGQKGEKGEKGEKGDSQAERADGQPQQSESQQAKQEKQDQDGQPGDSEGQKQEDAAAGAGQQEGKKDIEQAKMLEAMGKLSELLGQRSQEVTGQVMVEVGKTNQQLRTQFSDQQAGHAEAGSEIHRDEIPLMYQQYVERYFEEIRKAPEAPKAAAPKAAPAPKGKGE